MRYYANVSRVYKQRGSHFVVEGNRSRAFSAVMVGEKRDLSGGIDLRGWQWAYAEPSGMSYSLQTLSVRTCLAHFASCDVSAPGLRAIPLSSPYKAR